MKTALLFPGQGTDLGPAIAAWYEDSAEVRRQLELAAVRAGTTLDALLARGGAALRSTVYGQPMLTALSLAIHAELRDAGVVAAGVAGHSLGEMAAWAVTGSITTHDAIEACVKRGSLMATAAAKTRGGMLALLDATQTQVGEALATGRGRGVVDLAAHNSPDEWVLAGELAALHAIAERFPSRLLEVDGPWHSRLMAGAEDAFRTTLQELETFPMRMPLYCNATGERVEDPRQVADLLAGQLTRPLRWVDCIGSMARDGIEEFVICGPGKALRGMVRKILGARARIRVVQAVGDLHASKE